MKLDELENQERSDLEELANRICELKNELEAAKKRLRGLQKPRVGTG